MTSKRWLMIGVMVSLPPLSACDVISNGVLQRVAEPSHADGDKPTMTGIDKATPEEVKARRLLDAILDRDQGALEAAIRDGADPNLPVTVTDARRKALVGFERSPAVVLAARVSDPWFLEHLLAHGGSPSAEAISATDPQVSAFEQAVLAQREANLRALIRAGLNLKMKTRQGRGVLDVTANCLNFPFTTMLVKAGARPESGRDGGEHFRRNICDPPPALSDRGHEERRELIRELARHGYDLPCK